MEIKRRHNALLGENIESAVWSYSRRTDRTTGPEYETLLQRTPFSILAFLLPYPVVSRSPSAQVVEVFNQTGEEGGINLIEGIQSSLLVLKLNKTALRRTILRIHNWESKYHLEMSLASHGIRKLLHYIVSKQYLLYERHLLKRVDWVFHISADELKGMQKAFSAPVYQAKHVLCPPIAKAVINPDFSKKTGEFDSIFIFGDMGIPGNAIGIEWFVEKVWSILHKEYTELTLHIVGLGSEKIHADGVVGHGYVDSLEEFISGINCLCILPIAYGGGVKIKTIDVMASGMPTIYSTKALEGIVGVSEISPYAFEIFDVDDATTICRMALRMPDAIRNRSRYAQEHTQRFYSEQSFLNLLHSTSKSMESVN